MCVPTSWSCTIQCPRRFPLTLGFPGLALVVKNLPAIAEDIRDMGSVPGLGRFPGEGNDNRLQYSCLENLIDEGAWQATVMRSKRVGHD